MNLEVLQDTSPVDTAAQWDDWIAFVMTAEFSPSMPLLVSAKSLPERPGTMLYTAVQVSPSTSNLCSLHVDT